MASRYQHLNERCPTTNFGELMFSLTFFHHVLSVFYAWVGGYGIWISTELIKICWCQQSIGSTDRKIVRSLKLKIYSLAQIAVEKFMKLSKIGFSTECLRADVLRQNFFFICWVLAFNSKYFRDFLQENWTDSLSQGATSILPFCWK